MRAKGKAGRGAPGGDLAGGIVRLGIAVVLVFAPLSFGAVHAWAYGVVWGILWALVALWGIRAWRGLAKGGGVWEIRWIQAPFQPLIVLFGAWVALQTVPLPSWLVGWIQPNTLGAHRLAAPFTDGMPSALPLSLYPHGTWVAIMHLWSYGAIFYLTWYHLEGERHIRGLAFILVALGTFEGIYGLAEYLGGTHRIWWWRNPYSTWVHGTFINRDHLAGYLEMTLLVAAGVLLAARGDGGRGPRLSLRARLSRLARDDRWAKEVLLFFLCVLMGTALLLSLSRGAVMTLAVTFVPLSALLLFRSGTRRYGIVGLAIFLGMILYASPLGLEGLLEKFADMGQGMADRWGLWAGAWGMAMAHPWAGVGWGTFEWTFPAFRPETSSEILFDHAHNDWLELLAETGVVGSGLVLCGVILYMRAALRRWRERRDPWAVWLSFAAMATVAVAGTHSVGEFFLRTHANALTLAAMMAWGWVVLHHHSHGSERGRARWAVRVIRVPSWAGNCGMAGLACLHVVLGVGMARHLLAESAVPTERDSTVTRTQVADTALLRGAISLEPQNALRWSWLGREVMRQGTTPELLDWARQRGIAPLGEEQGGGASWARAFLAEAVRLNPTWPDHYLQMGWILASRPEWRRDGLAEEALRASVRLEPSSPVRHLHLGHYLLLDGRPQEAQAAFQEALRMAPHLRAHVEQGLRLPMAGKGTGG